MCDELQVLCCIRTKRIECSRNFVDVVFGRRVSYQSYLHQTPMAVSSVSQELYKILAGDSAAHGQPHMCPVDSLWVPTQVEVRIIVSEDDKQTLQING